MALDYLDPMMHHEGRDEAPSEAKLVRRSRPRTDPTFNDLMGVDIDDIAIRPLEDSTKPFLGDSTHRGTIQPALDVDDRVAAKEGHEEISSIRAADLYRVERGHESLLSPNLDDSVSALSEELSPNGEIHAVGRGPIRRRRSRLSIEGETRISLISADLGADQDFMNSLRSSTNNSVLGPSPLLQDASKDFRDNFDTARHSVPDTNSLTVYKRGGVGPKF